MWVCVCMPFHDDFLLRSTPFDRLCASLSLSLSVAGCELHVFVVAVIGRTQSAQCHGYNLLWMVERNASHQTRQRDTTTTTTNAIPMPWTFDFFCIFSIFMNGNSTFFHIIIVDIVCRGTHGTVNVDSISCCFALLHALLTHYTLHTPVRRPCVFRVLRESRVQ